ncbi:hypothetical protein Hanom_Chr14g01294771 [Helianthus anomalus]
MMMILLWFKLGFASTAAATAQFSYKDLLLDRYTFSSQVLSSLDFASTPFLWI